MIYLSDAEVLTIASPSAGMAVDTGRTGLYSVSIKDSNGGTVPGTLYTATAGELDAGILHLADPLSLSGHPAPWTLTHTIRLSLPNALHWVNRFDWRGGLSKAINPTLAGSVVIEEFQMQAGREIRLEPPQNMGSLARATLDRLDDWQSTPLKRMTLDIRGESFSVAFADQALEPRPVSGWSTGDDSERWFSALNFITVA